MCPYTTKFLLDLAKYFLPENISFVFDQFWSVFSSSVIRVISCRRVFCWKSDCYRPTFLAYSALECCVSWPAHAFALNDETHLKIIKKVHIFLHFSTLALCEPIVCAHDKKVLFDDFPVFFIIFDHVNAFTSMRLLVKIHNIGSKY